MAITLGSIALPDGLRWSDEHAWSPVSQSVEYGLTGSLIIEEATRQAGRPITLVGGRTWAWMTRENLAALVDALDSAPSTGLTLTLHDARTFQVLPRRDASGAVSAQAVPIVRDSGPANPSASTQYQIDEIRLMEIG